MNPGWESLSSTGRGRCLFFIPQLPARVASTAPNCHLPKHRLNYAQVFAAASRRLAQLRFDHEFDQCPGSLGRRQTIGIDL